MGFDCILLEGDFSSVTEINAQVQTQFLMSLERFRNLKYTELEIVGVKNRVQHQCGPASWASSRSFSILGDLICDHQGHTKVWNSYSSWSGPHLLTCSESCVTLGLFTSLGPFQVLTHYTAQAGGGQCFRNAYLQVDPGLGCLSLAE